jgi:hypothetical protein
LRRHLNLKAEKDNDNEEPDLAHLDLKDCLKALDAIIPDLDPFERDVLVALAYSGSKNMQALSLEARYSFPLTQPVGRVRRSREAGI